MKNNTPTTPRSACKCHCHTSHNLPQGVQCRCIKNCIHCHPENFPVASDICVGGKPQPERCSEKPNNSPTPARDEELLRLSNELAEDVMRAAGSKLKYYMPDTRKEIVEACRKGIIKAMREIRDKIQNHD